MQRMGFIDERTEISMAAKEAYESVFGEDPDPSRKEALQDLLLG